jgi:uncharacterized protein YecT (DUF1311 family)
MRFIVFLSLAFLFFTKAWADEVDCKKVITPVEESICLSNLQKTELDVNFSYKNLYRLLSDDLKLLLDKEQKSWINYRDDHCDLQGRMYGWGTMGTSAKVYCLSKMNKEKVKEIHSLKTLLIK